MPNHLQLINDVSEYKDISEKIISYIDMGYVEKIHTRRCQERDAVKRKRWKRSTNYYDSYKYCMLR